VAHKAIAQYHGTPFEKPLRMAFQKLTGHPHLAPTRVVREQIPMVINARQVIRMHPTRQQLDSREMYWLENLGMRCHSGRLRRRTLICGCSAC